MTPKKYSLKFWIIFWSTSTIFLVGWYFFWQTRNQKFETLETMANLFPWGEQDGKEFGALSKFATYLTKKDDQEKTFFILFQNNMELRPGGGYIGSFGILKIKNGAITKLETHDLSNFDARIPDGITPPYPIKETLNVSSWKLRDSNFSPDFLVNAKKAEEFYKIGKGEENFDGIISINANVLSSFLKVTGPIEVPGFPGTYDSKNAVVDLEYQVEKGFYKQDIKIGERKSVLNLLGQEIVKRISSLGLSDKAKLAGIILEDLKNKDIQLYFKDAEMQKQTVSAGWAGLVDQGWDKDYLMVVDSNMGALKSDRVIKRSIDYTADFSKSKPEAVLKITYTHTAKAKDWMTKNYLTFLRAYTPAGSWMTSYVNADKPVFAEDLGKKSIGFLMGLDLGQTKTVEIKYNISPKISAENYQLKIQKQSGLGEIPVKVTVIGKDGQSKEYSFQLVAEKIVGE